MSINLINYEAFALDYLEGNLPTERREEMELFLAKHPAIAQEFEEMKSFCVLEKQQVVYPHKRALLKRETDQPIQLSFYWKIASAAAIFLLMFSAYFLFSTKSAWNSNDGYVQESTPVIKEVPDKDFTKVPNIATTPLSNTVTEEADNQQLESTNDKAIVATTPKAERPQRTTAKPSPSIQKEMNTGNEFNNEFPIENNITQPTQIAKTQKTTLKKVDPIQKEIVVITLLPSLQQQEVTYNKTVILPLEQLHQQSLSGMVASTTSKRKSIKSLLGKFPIKVEKSSFIPTFFTEEEAGQ